MRYFKILTPNDTKEISNQFALSKNPSGFVYGAYTDGRDLHIAKITADGTIVEVKKYTGEDITGTPTRIVCVKNYFNGLKKLNGTHSITEYYWSAEYDYKVLTFTREAWGIKVYRDGSIRTTKLSSKGEVIKITEYGEYLANLEKLVKFGSGTSPVLPLMTNNKDDDIVNVFTTLYGDALEILNIEEDKSVNSASIKYGDKIVSRRQDSVLLDVVVYNGDIYALYDDGALEKNGFLFATDVTLLNAFLVNINKPTEGCFVPQGKQAQYLHTTGVAKGLAKFGCSSSGWGGVGSGDTPATDVKPSNNGQMYVKAGKHPPIFTECAYYVRDNQVVPISDHTFEITDDVNKIFDVLYFDSTSKIIMSTDALTKKIAPIPYNAILGSFGYEVTKDKITI